MNTPSSLTRRNYFDQRHPVSRQQGVVLLVSLLFLIVLTLLGVAASRMVTSEERQSRYLREYNTAFQASEAALRDARDDIGGALATDAVLAPSAARGSSRVKGAEGFFRSCLFGLCEYDPLETSPPWLTNDPRWANSVPYGTYSRRSPLPMSGNVGSSATSAKDEDGAAVNRFSNVTETSAVTGVWQQPTYLIEAIIDKRPGTNTVSVPQQSVPVVYRITARGFGADPNSRAVAQEIFTNAVSAGGF